MRTPSIAVAVMWVAVLSVGCGGSDPEPIGSSSSTPAVATRPSTTSTTAAPATTTIVTTTAPATTAPPSSSAPATTTISDLSSALDLHARSVLGFEPGDLDPLDPNALLHALTPVLGEPTRDTDWYTTPAAGSDGECLRGIRQRVIRWGNLGFAFWDQQGLVSLWSWTLGDPAASFKGDRAEPTPIPMTPELPLASSEGIAIGSTVTELVQVLGPDLVFLDAAGDRAVPESATLAYLSGFDARTPNLGVALSDGHVTGISGTVSFC